MELDIPTTQNKRSMNKLESLLLFFLVIAMGHACGARIKKEKHIEIISQKDKIQTLVRVYHFSSPEFMDMYHVLLDTCKRRYNCDNIDIINFSVGAAEDSTKYHFTHGGGPLVFQPMNTQVCFKVGRTIVFVPENQFKSQRIFQSALFIEEQFLTDLVQNSYNQCLFKNHNGNKLKTLFIMTFTQYKDGSPIFSLFGDYIE